MLTQPLGKRAYGFLGPDDMRFEPEREISGLSPDDRDHVRDQIEQLESKIEDLAQTAESCRTLMMFSKGAIVVGALLLLAVFGPVRLNPAVMIGAMAAVIG